MFLMDNAKVIAERVRELYRIVDELEGMHSGRKFSLDGHLIGSIGEVLAAQMYDLVLLPASAETHDAIAHDNRRVQIKATQVKRISMSSNPEHPIVLSINPNGTAEEVYNGPGYLVWDACGKMQKNGQRTISLRKLKDLMADMYQNASCKRRITTDAPPLISCNGVRIGRFGDLFYLQIQRNER